MKRKLYQGSCIGENIRRLRLQHNETQQMLGEMIGYGATTVANYESGYRVPDIETLQIIAAHYREDLSELLKPKDRRESETK